ncbi:reverse transcriptase [Phytophthora megakarya]|uniref:Reverse transcriptase n=1 Tax=Phytophthora megakarya TaxID=4795 RepID=A0A225WMJ1_9STRA|nr:reverse transcriptase [Phytophthora megakarya]
MDIKSGDEFTDVLADSDFITDASVSEAPNDCNTGKACGPDGLGNDWYRDYAATLVPILTNLYRMWYEAGKGNGANPLNYRPLALLNTDYKILTRLLSTKIAPTLERRIHPHQNGFVPGRHIHDTLDLFAAAQAMSKSIPESNHAIAVLLDFAKAYDSLFREFLYVAFTRHGYPSHFVRVIEALHTGTTVRFLINGKSSRQVMVTRGIRQGCPLAPDLFILALEPFYQKLQKQSDIRGIQLATDNECEELKVGGFADDTAAYLLDTTYIPALLDTTKRYGHASGLVINESKTIIIALAAKDIMSFPQLPNDFRYKDAGETSRYLGIQVGNSNTIEQNWELAEERIRKRLRLARQRTLTANQRSMVVLAVIIPAFLYVGRHSWPTTSIVGHLTKCIHNFVWFGCFEEDRIQGRAWISNDIASLPRNEGGLALPNLRAELLAMAAVAVTTWAQNSTKTRTLVGDILFSGDCASPLPMKYITPGYAPRPIAAFSKRTNLFRVGAEKVLTHGSNAFVQGYEEATIAFLNVVEHIVPPTLVWASDSVTVDCRVLIGSASAAYRKFLRTHYGELRTEWMGYMDIRYLVRLPDVGATTSAVWIHTINAMTAARLNQIIQWTTLTTGVVQFTDLLNGTLPDIRRLIVILIGNFPEMMYQMRNLN